MWPYQGISIGSDPPPETPRLYQVEIMVENGGKIADRYAQQFGIRWLEVTADKGFLLNGMPLELKGGCMHHDNGLLGSAAFDRAEERRVEIMKVNGFNAIRTSHNPPSEAFLNACDRLGMLVIDETFDMWERPKNPQDYHRFFRDWWKKDVEAMILRDRNHPSIFCWSIGNEINERADSSGTRIAKSIISFIRQMDTTRFFTNAICEFWDIPGKPWEATAPAFELLTIEDTIISICAMRLTMKSSGRIMMAQNRFQWMLSETGRWLSTLGIAFVDRHGLPG
jgi:beta-galactosidase